MEHKDSYVYPAIIQHADDGITVWFPDLLGCVTNGATDEEALFHAAEALTGYMVVLEEDNDPIPDPTLVTHISTSPGQAITLITADLHLRHYAGDKIPTFQRVVVRASAGQKRWRLNQN